MRGLTSHHCRWSKSRETVCDTGYWGKRAYWGSWIDIGWDTVSDTGCWRERLLKDSVALTLKCRSSWNRNVTGKWGKKCGIGRENVK